MKQSKGIDLIEPDYLAHRQNEALDVLEKGEIEQICVNVARPVDEHSLLLAPYMLNSADLITELGYNASVLTDVEPNQAQPDTHG